MVLLNVQAIEVVDLDQKIKMVEELDGHVMRCVRDQNGNHVIQKCIECVPEEAIHFIVSTFFDQVVTLSTHPYGCRVIQVERLLSLLFLCLCNFFLTSWIMYNNVLMWQRVLEHCNDQNTQSKVMDEILGAVSMLAQDQYGNYVVQVHNFPWIYSCAERTFMDFCLVTVVIYFYDFGFDLWCSDFLLIMVQVWCLKVT